MVMFSVCEVASWVFRGSEVVILLLVNITQKTCHANKISQLLKTDGSHCKSARQLLVISVLDCRLAWSLWR
jgi:hypothetical protein